MVKNFKKSEKKCLFVSFFLFLDIKCPCLVGKT